jgi:hypothetical protein
MQILYTNQAGEDVLGDLLSGDCVLWMTDRLIDEGQILESYSHLVRAPWRTVYIESASQEFARAIAGDVEDWISSPLSTIRHLIASDPTDIILPRRSLPIFFLDGREDLPNGESASLSKKSSMRRRLNMVAQLKGIEARRVIIVGSNPMSAIDELVDLWGTEFRALITVVSEKVTQTAEVQKSIEENTDLVAINWINQAPEDFARSLYERATVVGQDSSIWIKCQLPDGSLQDFDLGRAELAESALADVCDFIKVKDTLPLAPQDLVEDEFKGFFTRAEPLWRSYSAGLPWIPNPEIKAPLINGLKASLQNPEGSIRIFSIASEPGAGGTTLARAFAFDAAKAGFPVLLAKQRSDVPTALELSSFMFRAISGMQDAFKNVSDVGEPAWLVVLDVGHLDGAEDLWRFVADLARSRRKIVLLKVTNAESPLQPPKHIDHTELAYVNHDLTLKNVESLGAHLNIFLRKAGEEKSQSEWRSFWESHRPDVDTGVASFWIALEFWLAGYLELGESIQEWALKQFRNFAASNETKRGILEIAALSVERRALPERLLLPLQQPRVPWYQVLDEARHSSPGLGLVQAQSVPYGRVWAIAHDVLARYLINAVWNDRTLCQQLDVDGAEDPVALRLSLISKIAERPAIGELFARPLAIALAAHVLKLDEKSGNGEFFPYWRRVLSILETVPDSVAKTSRTFNHHLAISRRRVTQGEIFQIDNVEKKALLLRAVKEVTFALEGIHETPDDETDLNLLNTLALLYQELAGVERVSDGDRIRILEYLIKSDEMTRRALRQNPNNPYVLETAAKNLLRQEFDGDEKVMVQAAAEALSYVFKASALESAHSRKLQLSKLALEALKVLKSPSAVKVISDLCQQGNSFGYVAKAWVMLPNFGSDGDMISWESVTPQLATDALEILRQSPERDWLLVQLQYDLEVLANPLEFARQLALLDELSNTSGFRLSLQQRLERSVLLHQQGRHKPATVEFTSVRRDAQGMGQTILVVPDRLRWLLTPDRTRRAVCNARVVDSSSGRPTAQVTELAGTRAPFTPQEFSKQRMGPREVFKCQVNFSAMGPFLKPNLVDSSHR